MDTICKRCGCSHVGWTKSARTGRNYLCMTTTRVERTASGGREVTALMPYRPHHCGTCDRCDAVVKNRVDREVRDDDNNAAAYGFFLTDGHDDTGHPVPVPGCVMCAKGKSGFVFRGSWVPFVVSAS